MKLIFNQIITSFMTFVKLKTLPLLKVSLVGLFCINQTALASNNTTTSSSTETNSSLSQTQSDTSLINSRFESLKSVIFDQPYSQLPQYKVKKRFFGAEKKADENKLLEAAKRTFENTDDLIELPTNNKLLNANGICFSGTWTINQESKYSGLYKKGSNVAAIVRASVALSGTTQKNKRGFGMAIKLLPNDLGEQPSLNAFVLHSMGGTITKHVLDLKMDNEPPLGRLPKFSDLSTALRLRRDLEKADKEYGAEKPDASFRPVTVFSEYKSLDPVSPRWLRLSAMDEQRVDQNDFRDELNIENYSENLIRYQIEVAGDNNNTDQKKKNAQWQRIGILKLTQSITSPACDLNLHFQHPRLK